MYCYQILTIGGSPGQMIIIYLLFISRMQRDSKESIEKWINVIKQLEKMDNFVLKGRARNNKYKYKRACYASQNNTRYVKFGAFCF